MDKKNEELLKSLGDYYEYLSSLDCDGGFMDDLLKSCKKSIDFLNSEKDKMVHDALEGLRRNLDGGYRKQVTIDLEKIDDYTFDLFKEFVSKSIGHYSLKKKHGNIKYRKLREGEGVMLGREYVNNITGSICLVYDVVRNNDLYVRAYFNGNKVLKVIKIDDFKKHFSIVELDGKQGGNKD